MLCGATVAAVMVWFIWRTREQRLDDRRRVDEKMRQLSRAVEQSPASIVITDRAGRIEYVNPRFCAITGYAAEEVLGQNPRFLKSGEMPPEAYQKLWQTITSGRDWHGEFRNRKKNGELCWVLAAISPVFNAEGRITHFLAVEEDITERKRMEKELRQFQFATDQAADAVFWINRDGKFYYVNDQACRSLGYSREELMALRVFDIDPGLSPERWAKRWEESPRRQMAAYQLESLHRRKDGSTFPVEITARHFSASDAELHVAFARDITARRQAEEKIREQAAWLDKAPDAIFVLDLEGTIIYWNQGAERIFGWAAAEAVGTKFVDLLFHGVVAPRLREAAQITRERGEWAGELAEFTKDGRSIVIQGRASLIRDEQGRPKGILVIDTDITEKKQIEEKFLRAQRMESLGALAGGIAHDLNNVLTPLLISAELLKDKITDADGKRMLAAMEANVHRAAKLVKQVLTFGRGISGERVPVQLESIARDIGQMVNQTFPKSVEFELQAAADLWPVVGDPTQLHQVLLNLCVNARDAMPAGGRLSVTLANTRLDENYPAKNPEAKAGAYVVIRVADNGTGIPKAIQPRIFEPFFTTKKDGGGSGLGLSTSLGIVRSHGGFIQCYSEEGRGSTFNVYLPAQFEPAGLADTVNGPFELPRGRGELVLLVDDEPPIREVAQSILERFGYRVLTAADGAEAIALYRSRRAEIAAVVTDLIMPGMDGPAVITALKAVNPAVNVIVSSGLASPDTIARVKESGVSHFIPKPYTAETLLQSLRQLLRGEARH